eukprot:Awhi_evm1s2256
MASKAAFVATEFGVVFSSYDHDTLNLEDEADLPSKTQDQLRKKLENRRKEKIAEEKAAEKAAQKAAKQKAAEEAGEEYIDSDLENDDDDGNAEGTNGEGGDQEVDKLRKDTEDISITNEVARPEDLPNHAEEVRTMLNQVKRRNEEAAVLKRLAKSHARSKGNSKANPSQFVHKEKPADNPSRRAVVHHTSSHYVMSASKQYAKGNKISGIAARKQGMSKAGQNAQKVQSERNMANAREAAKGKRSANNGSKGKAKSASKTKKAQNFSRQE